MSLIEGKIQPENLQSSGGVQVEQDFEMGGVVEAGKDPQDPQTDFKNNGSDERMDQGEKETLTCEICYDTIEVERSPPNKQSKLMVET